MLNKKQTILYSATLVLLSAQAGAMVSAANDIVSSGGEFKGVSGEYIVGLGPVELGGAVLKTTCDKDTCSYETRIKGSFMFIGADIKERGTFRQDNHQVLPISTLYDEKIGSKRRHYTYDYLAKEIENRKNNTQMELPEHVFPFMPLLNQVILDLSNGGPKKYYEFFSKHKVRRADISRYRKTPTERGTMHHFIGTQKDKEIEFFFLEKGDAIGLEKISYGSFHLSRKEKTQNISSNQ